jgi:hypothetical protein
MLIIPELQKVVIFAPRTGSGSLRRVLRKKYPESMLIYRHMEADGVPAGYDRWPKFCVVRDPVARMFSLWNFMRDVNWRKPDQDAAYNDAVKRQGEMEFEDWLLNNNVPFTSPYDSAGLGRYWPGYTVRHPLPENRKSQFLYARPDLGTKLLQFGDHISLSVHFGIEPGEMIHENKTGTGAQPPKLSSAADDYVNRWFAWDLAATGPATLLKRPREFA